MKMESRRAYATRMTFRDATTVGVKTYEAWNKHDKKAHKADAHRRKLSVLVDETVPAPFEMCDKLRPAFLYNIGYNVVQVAAHNLSFLAKVAAAAEHGRTGSGAKHGIDKGKRTETLFGHHGTATGKRTMTKTNAILNNEECSVAMQLLFSVLESIGLSQHIPLGIVLLEALVGVSNQDYHNDYTCNDLWRYFLYCHETQEAYALPCSIIVPLDQRGRGLDVYPYSQGQAVGGLNRFCGSVGSETAVRVDIPYGSALVFAPWLKHRGVAEMDRPNLGLFAYAQDCNMPTIQNAKTPNVNFHNDGC